MLTFPFRGRSVGTLSAPCGGASNPPDQAKGPLVLVIVMPASIWIMFWLGFPAPAMARLAGPIPIDGLATEPMMICGIREGLTKGAILPKSIPAR